MNLKELREELELIVRDSVLQTKIDRWINDALLQMAGNFDFPALQRLDPWPFTVTTANWQYTPPENFHRDLFMCRNSTGGRVSILNKFSTFEALDPDHSETGANVTHIFTQDLGESKKFCVFPKANDDLDLYFFEKPPYLDSDLEEPYWVPKEYRHNTIIPLVVIRNYRLILSTVENPPDQGLAFWQSEYKKGLFGEPMGDIGMINFMARPIRPQRSGGRDPLP